MAYRQLELFSIDDMYGYIGVEDEIESISVAAYLWAIRFVSRLDDEMFRKVKEGCDAVKIGGGKYYVPFVPGCLNIYKLVALRECLDLRQYAIIGENYVHHYPEAGIKSPVSYRHAFVMARKAFKEYNAKEYQKSGWWVQSIFIRESCLR